MVYTGKSYCFGDNITTDYISPGRYKMENLTEAQHVMHMMEDIRPHFGEMLQPGDFIVAGSNFGCGSSRESAPAVIKAAGVPVIIAKSFARIFFRNAMRIGMTLVECDTSDIRDGHELEVDAESGILRFDGNELHGKVFSFRQIEEIYAKI